MPHKCPVILVQTNVKTTSSIVQAQKQFWGSMKNIQQYFLRKSIFFKKAVVKCQNKWMAMIVRRVCNSVTFITYSNIISATLRIGQQGECVIVMCAFFIYSDIAFYIVQLPAFPSLNSFFYICPVIQNFPKMSGYFFY